MIKKLIKNISLLIAIISISMSILSTKLFFGGLYINGYNGMLQVYNQNMSLYASNLDYEFYQTYEFDSYMNYNILDSVITIILDEYIHEDNFEYAKENLKNNKNVDIFAINKSDKDIYTNTEYKTTEAFLKNDKKDISIHVSKDNGYINISQKVLNKEVPSSMDVSYLDIGQDYDIYMSVDKEPTYDDDLKYMYASYEASKEAGNTIIAIFIISLIMFITSFALYKIIKIDKNKNLVPDILKNISVEIYLMIILGISIFIFEGYMYADVDLVNYKLIYNPLQILYLYGLIFIDVVLFYFMCKKAKSYDNYKDMLNGLYILKIISFIGINFNKGTKRIQSQFKNIWMTFRTVKITRYLLIICISCIVLICMFDMMWNGFITPISLVSSTCLFMFTLVIVNKISYLNEIIEGTKIIKNGDLNYKIPIRGNNAFTALSEDINNIGEGLEKSIEKEFKSERMRSELISNVSHDLKTPLTSIINYVQLIKKEENITPDYINDYVNILDSKSKRLKVLIEDLFEASKASSGTIELDMQKIELSQLLRQSIGEMEEKLNDKDLNLKINFPENKVYINADGRRMFRVFENLLSNISKYSLDRTRVYIDLEEEEEEIKLTMKNISSYELNFNPDEIVERFKRADESRNTEGSGLGLSIARDLTTLQGGKFDIEIDGDLFKVILKFNKYNEPTI